MQWAAANLLVLSRVLAANIGVVEGRVSRLGRYGDDEILVRQFVFGCGSGSCNGRFCGGNDGCGESVEPVFLNVLYISVCFQWYCGGANGCVGGFVVMRFGCGGILELLRDGAAQGVAAIAGSVFSVSSSVAKVLAMLVVLSLIILLSCLLTEFWRLAGAAAVLVLSVAAAMVRRVTVTATVALLTDE